MEGRESAAARPAAPYRTEMASCCDLDAESGSSKISDREGEHPQGSSPFRFLLGSNRVKIIHRFRSLAALAFVCFSCTSTALAQQTNTQLQIRDTGISGLWILANISYAGMRAQNHRSVVWRMLAFIFGLPGTLVTFFAVTEGCERAYGIDLPRKGRS
jgi:hypothetical protein